MATTTGNYFRDMVPIETLSFIGTPFPVLPAMPSRLYEVLLGGFIVTEPEESGYGLCPSGPPEF